MCGLVAVFRPGGVDPQEPARMLEQLAHRGPDARGIWTSPDRRLVLGHNRLKIIDLSDGANQPMVSPDGRWVLIYNGEIVNYRDLRARYRGDWQFRTQGDTEILLADFAQRGVDAMNDWVGMFAFALLDR
jgi:asparagine synthase (glutamine-hydrolysing)